jgi:hypothetical protein
MQTGESTLAEREERDERLSRRQLLRLGTVVGLGALVALTACGEGDGDDDDDDDDDDD